ncbi:START domain-containing protein [Isoalcanivorax indicus]|uniref:START domain-containing protein n=1 Tax=Isoalcanivorax indicus TaxID=2202653 RepID=UPI0013C3EA5C|nr:START domain-containing protein [Isoalcanivorax indicus]
MKRLSWLPAGAVLHALACIIMISPGTAGARAGGLAETVDWRLITDREGIRVFAASSEASRVSAFRGEMQMRIDDFRGIALRLDNYEAVAAWMHMVSAITELDRRHDHDRDLYLTTHLPWPVRNRDVVLQIGLHQDPDDYTLTLQYDDIDRPGPVSPGYVRMPQMVGTLRFTPLEAPLVAVTFEVTADPGGAIPGWLSNMLLRDIPYFSLYRLNRMINQTPLPERPYHPDIKAPPGWP